MNMKKIQKKRIPRFVLIEEEAAFWDTHSIADYLTATKTVKNIRFRRNIPPKFV